MCVCCVTCTTASGAPQDDVDEANELCQLDSADRVPCMARDHNRLQQPGDKAPTTAPGSLVHVSAGLITTAIAAISFVFFAGHTSVSHSLTSLFESSEPANSSSAHPSLSSLPFASRSRAARGQSAVIIQVESRPLTANISDATQFHSLSAAINYQYALAHGYECTLLGDIHSIKHTLEYTL